MIIVFSNAALRIYISFGAHALFDCPSGGSYTADDGVPRPVAIATKFAFVTADLHSP